MNVAIVRRSYEAFARGDMDAVLADMADDIEWQQAQGLPHGGTYRGLPAVRANIFDPLDRDWWSVFSAVPDEFLDAGDEVVVLGRYRGEARQTVSSSTSRSSTCGRCETRKRGAFASSSTRRAGSTR